MTKQKCTVYFDPDEWEALQAAARVIAVERGEAFTASEAVRLAVGDFLETHPYADRWRLAVCDAGVYARAPQAST